jgi:hypothetical protein
MALSRPNSVKIAGQRDCGEVGLLELEARFAGRIHLEDQVGLAAEERVHRSVEGRLEVLHSEPALFGVMAPGLEGIDAARRRSTRRKEAVQREVHVALARREQRN